MVVGNELFNGEGMTTANEPLEAFILSDLLQNPQIHDHEKHRPGVQTSLRSGLFPGVKTTRDGSSLEPKIHAVGLNIRYICRCYKESSGMVCQCFHDGDLACRALYLSRNNLTSGRGLESFQHATTLSLADNLFNHVPIELSQMTHLKRLNFAGNVMAEAMPHCRERILAYTSPRLCELDGMRVSKNEVWCAQKIVFQECMLRNIVFLLRGIHVSQGALWEEDYEAICIDIQRTVDNRLGARNVETLEDFVCSLRDFSLQFLVLEEDADIWSRVKPLFSKGASSWNHGLAMLAVKLWNDVTYPREWNTSSLEDFGVFSREVTSSLDSLEAALRNSAEGQSTEVEDSVMMIWVQFYILVSNFRTPDTSVETISVQSSPISEDAGSDGEEGDTEIMSGEDATGEHELMMALQNDNDHLRSEIENHIEICRTLSRDKEEMTAVLSLLQDNLELMNKKKQEISEENRVLIEQIQVAERDRNTSMERAKELQDSYEQYKKDICSKMQAQEAKLNGSIATLMHKLDALEKEPRVPLHIEIVNPDIRHIIEEKDASIKWMQVQLDFFQKKHEKEAKADAFKKQWKKQRMNNAKHYSFASWRRYTKYANDIKLFEAEMEESRHGRRRQLASSYLSQWHALTVRSNKLMALSARIAEKECKSICQKAYVAWIKQCEQSARVRLFMAMREGKTKKLILDHLQLYKCLWHERTTNGLRAADRIYDNKLKGTSIHAWLQTYRSQKVAREERLQDSQRDSRLVSKSFGAWRQVNTESQIQALGKAFSNHRIASKSFCVFVETNRRSKMLKNCFSKLAAWKERQRCSRAMHLWRAKVKSTKILLARHCLLRWYSELLLQRYICHLAVERAMKNKSMLKQAFCLWKTHAWQSKHHKYKTIDAKAEHMKNKSLMRQYFSTWVSTLLYEKIESQSTLIARLEDNMQLIASSCNAMKDTALENYTKCLKYAHKSSSESTMRLEKLRKQHNAVKKTLASCLDNTSTMRREMAELDAMKACQDEKIESLQDVIKSLSREKYLLELRLRASDTIKASVSHRATRAMKTSSMATETLLSVWQHHEPFMLTGDNE